MKKLFGILFLFGIVCSTPVLAQNFEFETIRTEQTPGFFMMRIFPLEGNKTIPVNPIFVKNFSQSEEDVYEELMPFIQELHGVVIEKEDLRFYTEDSENKIVFLGAPEKGYLHFKINRSDDGLAAFQSFQQKHFENIVFRNIEMKFGGNIYDVLPSYIPDITSDPITIIGKFRKDMKTRLEIKGEIAEGIIESIEPLNIQDKSYSQTPLAKQIPDLWEELWKRENPSPSTQEIPKTIHWLEWNNYFPILLFILGIVCFVAAIRSINKNYDPLLDEEDFVENQHQSQHIPLKEAQRKSITKEKKPVSNSPHKPLSEKDALKKISPNSPSAKDQSTDSSPFVDMPQIQDAD